MVKTTQLAALAVLLAFGFSIAGARGAGAVKLIDVVELSGAGATAGTNWRNGIDLAVKDINAKGGIFGRQIEITHYDTQSNPSVAKALVTKAIDEDPYIVLGPVFSGSVAVSMAVTQQAEIPEIMAGEATNLTTQGDDYLFRTSFSQVAAMPKIADYLANDIKAKSVAVVWVNNDFGKGGRDAIVKELQARSIKVVADVPTEQNQIDFSSTVLAVAKSDADAAFIYLNEDESARILKELRKQAYAKPLVGETTLIGQKVIELAGDAANGVQGHVGLTVDAPLPAFQAFDAAYQKAYGTRSDHNGIKGYFAVHLIKAVTEKIGKFDRKLFAKTMKGIQLSAKDDPGLFLDVTYNDKGDPDRESFLVEVKGGKQSVLKLLPPLGKRAAN